MCEEALLRDTQVKFKPVLLSPKTDFKHPPHRHTLSNECHKRSNGGII